MGSFLQNRNSIIRWIIIVILILIIIFGFHSYVKSIYQKELNKYSSQTSQFENEMKSSIENSPKSAYDLTVLGKKMLNNNQTYWATVVLETAVKKDPQYRDAALLTGYSYLKSAETINDKQYAISYSNLAIVYLIKARDLDPVYARTHELLALAYKNIGDAENAALSAQKAKTFNKD
ncbi:hypothetical protein A3F08_01720 [Candidatus Berkelbacteria bacterium RIFCSPHIGHO2_12_FULL_36_9]|uniref:Tetratricopeptide repeat-like domain-containing protein n=1 Tax=Candidatus Berkelbacteria bacterium RIFCSPHIGHO2_12_FULL_36_9 TaxID=1797469 RepID=A0A1F5EDP2_9BACT|nr:MAG: hypothetical protein A3F08_01720 [Candidatus Berkelbacteria bacterium RIFCSPHIGHO2_12_FULL_36_9]